MHQWFRAAAALAAILSLAHAYAGDRNKEEKAAARAAESALKEQWKADNEQVVVALPAGLSLDQAREAILQHAMRNAWTIDADHKYQIVFSENLADKHPTAAAFVQALAYDPGGGPMMIHRTVSFIYGDNLPPSVRVCVTVGQQNRFGGTSQSDCRLPFKTWKEGREKISDIFERAVTSDTAKDSAVSEGGQPVASAQQP